MKSKQTEFEITIDYGELAVLETLFQERKGLFSEKPDKIFRKLRDHIHEIFESSIKVDTEKIKA